MTAEGTEATTQGRVPKRLVFISHAHADRQLAQALLALVRAVFSGVVEPYVSSDPTPGGGIQPGDEWYSAIHERLLRAEAVWVLATPTSITRPWLYWEAGIGRAVCSNGVTVLRVGLEQSEVFSPLNAFQGFDGLNAGDAGMGELLNKVAKQIDMMPPAEMVKIEVEKWIATAQSHQPDEPTTDGGQPLTPEQVDKLATIVSNLELVSSNLSHHVVDLEAARTPRSMAQRLRSVPVPPPPPRPTRPAPPLPDIEPPLELDDLPF